MASVLTSDVASDAQWKTDVRTPEDADQLVVKQSCLNAWYLAPSYEV